MRIRIALRSDGFLGACRRCVAPNSAGEGFRYDTLRLTNHETGLRIPEKKGVRKVVLQHEINREEHQSRLGLGMLGLEGARIPQDNRTDVLGQSYGTDVPRSQVQDSHALCVERQAHDSCVG